MFVIYIYGQVIKLKLRNMLNYFTVQETIDIPETAINILKTSSLTNITERDVYESNPDKQLELLKNSGACLIVQNLFKINWQVAQEILVSTVIQN